MITPEEALKIFQTLGGPDTAAERIALKQLRQVDFSGEFAKWPDSPDMLYLLRKLKDKDKFPEVDLGRLEGRIEGHGYREPNLWPSTLPSDPKVHKALEKRGFKGKNPFGPENAELDTSLKDIFFPPEFWETFLSPTPLWIRGPSGAGHTALALMLCYRSQFNPPIHLREVFPVHLSLHHLSTQQELAGQILRGAGRSLLQFLSLNPYGLLEQKPAHIVGMSELIRWMYPEVNRLEQAFCRMGADIKQGGGKWVMDKLKDVAPPRGVEEEPSHWLKFVPPAGYSRLYLLLETTDTLAPEHSRILERWASRWPRDNIYLKILEKSTSPSSNKGVESMPLQIDLKGMLRTRIRWNWPISGGALQPLCDTPISNPNEALVKAAAGSPRQLVQLGNRLLKVWARRTNGDSKISLDDFKKAGIL